MRVRIGALQIGPRRSVSDDDLAARQPQRQERVQVLFHRDAPDAEEDRPRQVEQALRTGMEQAEIDAAAPAHDIAEAMALQFLLHRRGRDHHGGGRRMEAAQQPVAPAFGDRPARRDILREAGVIAGGEGSLLRQADRAREPADRPFRRDMDMVGREIRDPCRERPAGGERQADIGIARQADLAEALRRQRGRRRPEIRRRLDHPLERAHHPVDLRPPGVGRDQDAHHAASTSSGLRTGRPGAATGVAASPFSRLCGQRIISKRPS